MKLDFWLEVAKLVLPAIVSLVEDLLKGDDGAKQKLEDILGPREMLELELAVRRAQFIQRKG